MRNTISISFLLAILFLVMSGAGEAKVTGECSNCHTMHNSQNGGGLASAGTGAGWSQGAGWSVDGGNNDQAQAALLVTDCLGCHTSTTGATIIQIGSSRIPIVYNNIQQPVNPLAGGNFYWVATLGDAYGHNVRGISAQDQALAVAPGAVGCANSCHVTLTLSDAETDGNRKNGCQGCHNRVSHHGSDPANLPVTATGGWYRFLSAPSGHNMLGGAGVTGIEDPNWEQTATANNHNIYYGGTGADNESPQSMGKFCAGCHYNFHSPGNGAFNFWGLNNGGNGNPWLRHPADAVIPSTGEYAAIINADYDPKVPVGKPDLGSYNAAKVQAGDKVICLSCHRAHGSPNPDMLRWDYATMLTGATGAAAGTGCFKCHSTKDGI